MNKVALSSAVSGSRSLQRRYNVLVSVLLLLLPIPLLAGSSVSFEGRVVGVTDGDTVTIFLDGHQVKVRLFGIDSPEGGQAVGNAAKRFTSSLLFGKSVIVHHRGIDRYRRTLADVSVEGHDAGMAIVRAGYAWHFVRYSDDPELAAAEKEARIARRGLWQDPNPVPPWNYRHPARDHQPALVAESVIYHGNSHSRVFHSLACQYYSCKNCLVSFPTKAAARSAGFRPHKECVYEP